MFFLRQAEKHGPISKVLWDGKVTICIVGHERARRFPDEAEDKHRAASPNLRSVFPIGFLGAMEGEPHRKYRHIMLSAFKATSLEAHDIAVRKIIRNTLGVLAGASEPPVPAATGHLISARYSSRNWRGATNWIWPPTDRRSWAAFFSSRIQILRSRSTGSARHSKRPFLKAQIGDAQRRRCAMAGAADHDCQIAGAAVGFVLTAVA